MARFFAVNWAITSAWLALAVVTTSTTAYWYDQVYGWRGAEATAAAELHAKGIDATHYKTTDYGDSVRVLYSRTEPGHYVDVSVRKKQGKWAVTSINKDFVPWTKDDPALR